MLLWHEPTASPSQQVIPHDGGRSTIACDLVKKRQANAGLQLRSDLVQAEPTGERNDHRLECGQGTLLSRLSDVDEFEDGARVIEGDLANRQRARES